jgi:hypothetical protein
VSPWTFQTALVYFHMKVTVNPVQSVMYCCVTINPPLPKTGIRTDKNIFNPEHMPLWPHFNDMWTFIMSMEITSPFNQ